MKRTTRILAVAGVAVAAIVAAGAGLAHPGGMGWGGGPGYGMGYGPGPGMGYGPGHGMGAWGGADAQAAMAGRLAALKAELKITPAQQQAWTAYENQMQQQASSMQALRQQMQDKMRSGATPDSAEMSALREGMFKLHQANIQARAAVEKDLLAALTPEQRTIAEQRLHGGSWGPGYGPGRGPGYGMGGGPGYGMGGGRFCPGRG